jgi:hypothetical protein
VPSDGPRTAGRWLLGGALLYAGAAHLTFARQEFRAQVPGWLPLDADLVVLASGVVELGLDSDRARLVRLFFQPVLVVWALWSTGAWRAISSARRRRRSGLGTPPDPRR